MLDDILPQDAVFVAQNQHSNDTCDPGAAKLKTKDPKQTFTVSLFPKLATPQGKQLDLTFAEFSERLSRCDIRPIKDGPLISGAIYHQENIHRSNKNVLAVSVLWGDADESHTLDELCKIIQETGSAAVLYSSFSHGIPDIKNHPDAHAPGERYRVGFPLNNPIPAIDYPDVWERFNLLFNGEIDPACKDASRGYYTPSHPTGEGFVFRSFDGRFLNTASLPELPANFNNPTFHPSAGTGQNGGRPGDDFNSTATNEDTAHILESHGWKVTRSSGPVWKVKRPGKHGPGIGATIGHYGPGILHVFTSNGAPFEAQHAYRPFGVLALLEFGGDFEAAAKSLASRGFGERPEGFGGFGGFGDYEEENYRNNENQSSNNNNHAQYNPSANVNEGYNQQQAQGFGGFGGFGGSPKFDKAPAPLTTRLRPVPKFDPLLLPEPFRPSVMDAAERLSCPADYVAVPLVIAAASMIGRSLSILPKLFDDWMVTPNLWGAVIGRPGTKKTPAAAEGLRHLKRLEATALEAYESRKKNADQKNKVNEVQRNAIKAKMQNMSKTGKASRAELEIMQEEIDELEDEDVKVKRYMVADATIESLGNVLAENPRGVLQNRDELIGWLSNLDKQGRESDKAFFMEAFNGAGSFTYDRISRGHLHIPNVCVSLFGTIQPGPIGQLIRAASEDSAQRNGFISRFQLLVYPDNPTYKHIDRYADTEAKNRTFEVFEKLDALTAFSIGASIDEDSGQPYLRFEPAAQTLFDEWLKKLEVRLNSHCETTLLEEHFSKYRSLMPSLALIFHAVDVVDGVAPAGPVTYRSAGKAAAWCEYLEEHARRIYGQAFNGETETLERLAERLHELPNPFVARDIYKNKGWAGLKDKDEVDRLLWLLHEAHWVHGKKIEPTPGKGGRPTTKFWINPAVLEAKKGQS